MNNKVKVSFKDGEELRILKGYIIGEDDFFFEVDCDLNSYKINKNQIVAIKKGKDGVEGNGYKK